MENTLKEYKRIWRIRQEYFALYGEYANWHKSEPNFWPNPESFDPKSPYWAWLDGQKQSYATVPLKL